MNNENQQIIKNDHIGCNHNYQDDNNTLIGVPKLKMVTPTRYYLKCNLCGEIITVAANIIQDKKKFLHHFF